MCTADEDTDASPRPGSGSPHRINKQDISNPTRTHGPLFKTGTTFDSDEEDNLLQGLTMTEQRAKVCGLKLALEMLLDLSPVLFLNVQIMELPCPIEDSLKNQTKHARHRR